MDHLFPIGVGILLILFLATNFELLAMLVNYVLMICLIALVSAAIGYGLYDSLGPEISVLLAAVTAGLLVMTKLGYSIAGFIKGFVEGWRAGPVKKT